MKTIKVFLVLVLLTAFIGCGAVTRTIDYGEMKTDVAMSESIFLTPTDAPKTVFAQIRNTSSNQAITGEFESVILSNIQGKGYYLVRKPSEATYVLQANVRYIGEWRDGMNLEGTLTGTGLGALAGLGLSGGRGGTAIGGLLGAGLGFVADMATRVQQEVMVVEFQIAEILTPEQDITGIRTNKGEIVSQAKTTSGMGTRPDLPTTTATTKTVASTKEGVKVYNAGVAARAAQIRMDVSQAIRQLVQMSGQQIAGIF
jgi:hypothetical protein